MDGWGKLPHVDGANTAGRKPFVDREGARVDLGENPRLVWVSLNTLQGHRCFSSPARLYVYVPSPLLGFMSNSSSSIPGLLFSLCLVGSPNRLFSY